MRGGHGEPQETKTTHAGSTKTKDSCTHSVHNRKDRAIPGDTIWGHPLPKICLQRTPDLFSCCHFPPPLLSEVCRHPLHLLQEIIPLRFWPRSLLKLGQPSKGPQTLFAQLRYSVVDVILLLKEANTDISLVELLGGRECSRRVNSSKQGMPGIQTWCG